MRGVKPEEHAHTLLANLLRDVPVPKQERLADQEERDRLIAAVKSGDKKARLKLMVMVPDIPAVDTVTGGPTPIMPQEALSREYIYED